jgi:hypothetical protein
MASKKVKPKIIEALEFLGQSTVWEVALEVDESESIVAATLKRMAEDGEVVLDVANRRVQLSELEE